MSYRSLPILALLALLSVPSTMAQVSVPATPPSLEMPLGTEVPTHKLPLPDVATLKQDAAQRDEAGLVLLPQARDRVTVGVHLGLENAGQWEALPDGSRVWRLRLEAQGAESMHLIYDDFWMPPGARLFLYDDDRRVVLGAFTEQNNKAHGGFATDFVPGRATTLEYYEPAGVPEPGRLHIANALQLLSDEARRTLAGGIYTASALSCSINVACSEGDGWGDAISATVRISNGCTGVLLNNTSNDGTPYVLTANHCGSPQVGDVVNWVFQFNYESATCADPAETPSYQSVSGAVVRAADDGIADFTLLELLEPVPASFNAHFAGWSIENTAPTRGVVVGHPRGDIKKITLDDDPVAHFGSSHWKATFDQGVIQSGSSGSPLFNEQHLFVGHVRASLQLDENACSGPGGDDNNAEILFPKLSYIWNVGASGQQVANFLDPDGTGSTNVATLGPSEIWINEVNTAGSSGEDDEFVEIVGPANTDLSGYKLEVYTCVSGSASPAGTYSLNSFTLGNDYGNYGIFVMGGAGISASKRHQSISASSLPNGSGLLLLKDNTGTTVFDYQYDSQSSGAADCPAGRTTRSVGDPAGSSTMGFAINNPRSIDQAVVGLTASPSEQNSDSGQELPVELVAFDAVRDGQAVELRWQTASETNNAGFEVQHKDSDAASPWGVAAFVEGNGTTLEAEQYTYRLTNLAPGTYRFRLKQVDFDGTFAYSPEVEVAVGVPGTYQLSAAYPNPFNPQTSFSLSVARAQHVDIGVFDLLGRRVARLHDGPLEAGTTTAFTFEAAGLPSGLYLVRAVGEQFLASQRVTLLK